MKKEYFQEYMEFLFKVLFKLEEKYIDTQIYPRLYGFLAERLLICYLHKKYIEKKNLKILELKVAKAWNVDFSKSYFEKQYGKLKHRLNLAWFKKLYYKYFK